MRQITVLWAVPRSISTAFERYFIERKDCTIMHDEFSFPYYYAEQNAVSEIYEGKELKDDRPMTYEGVKEWIYREAEKRPVFVKDMSYAPFNHIMQDEKFLKDIVSTFLIRDPKTTIRSFYTLQKELNNKEIGFECSWKLYERVKEVTGKAPLIVQAENLEDNPECTMQAYCVAIGVAFIKEALYWQADAPKEWEDWAEWHGDAMRICGIQKSVEKFDYEIEDIAELKAWYEYSLPYYEKLKAEALHIK